MKIPLPSLHLHQQQIKSLWDRSLLLEREHFFSKMDLIIIAGWHGHDLIQKKNDDDRAFSTFWVKMVPPNELVAEDIPF